jgi:hypothetical protein
MALSFVFLLLVAAAFAAPQFGLCKFINRFSCKFL